MKQHSSTWISMWITEFWGRVFSLSFMGASACLSQLNSSSTEEVITQHGRYLVSVFLGGGHWIYFIYTSLNYSQKVFLAGTSKLTVQSVNGRDGLMNLLSSVWHPRDVMAPREEVCKASK